jgi:heme/copper-type cytochrome/quinol oxidase subunit 4
MKKQLTKVYIALIILTLLTAILSNNNTSKIVIITILLISCIKFLVVAFQFMELKKANQAWKVSLSLFLFVLIGIIALII